MSDYRSSPVIHDAMLDVAYDLLAEARRLADKGGEGALKKSRNYCLGVLLLVCSALEAAINVVAGAYYDGGPGEKEAEEAGWTEMWHGWGHSLSHKWTEYAPKIAGPHFAQRALPGWKDELTAVIRTRNDVVAHFKGRWADEDAQKAFGEMSICDAEHWFVFTRRLVGALRSGYMSTHLAISIHDQPGTPYPKPARRHPFIEPVSTGSAGTVEMEFLDIPKDPVKNEETKTEE